jgi:hypothetical protein
MDSTDFINEILDTLRKNMINIVKEQQKLKKEKILEAAKELDKHNIKPRYTICAKICKALDGIEDISPQWIRDVLRHYDEGFIDTKKRNITITKKEPEEETRAEKMMLVVGNNGKQVLEKENEKPISILDKPEYRKLNTQLAETTIELEKSQAIINNKNPIIADMLQLGFDPFDKHPFYYKGTPMQIKTQIMQKIGNNANKKFFVLIQEIV